MREGDEEELARRVDSNEDKLESGREEGLDALKAIASVLSAVRCIVRVQVENKAKARIPPSVSRLPLHRGNLA